MKRATGGHTLAGYSIYSLDWAKFQKFVNEPTRHQLLAFAAIISNWLEGESDEANPVRDWPSEPKELCPLVKERLARPDWYSDLSDASKEMWCEAVYGFCCNIQPKEVGFRADHDGVYWDVIELAAKQFKLGPDQISRDVALSAFGKRPYRYDLASDAAKSRERKAGDEEDPDDEDFDFGGWQPMHSMHTPDEVQKMLEELRSIRSVFENSKNKQAINDYDVLIPVLEKLAEQKRMLFIQVDT